MNRAGRHGHADLRTLSDYESAFASLNAWEREIESIHLYPFLAFVMKNGKQYLR